MGRKKTPGLIKREGIWHIDKQVRGRRIRKSCGTGSLREAETYLVHRLEEIRQAEIFGVRPTRMFRTAATKFVQENGHKRSLRCDIGNLRNLMPWIGELELNRVNMGTLQPGSLSSGHRCLLFPQLFQNLVGNSARHCLARLLRDIGI